MRHEIQENKASPFFEILAEAEEISVREVTRDDRPRNKREFVVFVTGPSLTPLESALKKENAESNLPRDYLLESAELLVRNKDYLLGRNVYSFLLKKDIRDREALRGLGICLLRLGDFTASRKCFRAFYELFKEEEGLFWLGVNESQQGKDLEAARYFEQIKHPEYLKGDLQFEFYKEAGNVFARVQSLEKAEAFYKQAMNLNPASDAVFVNLGTLAIQQKRYEAAHTHFAKALSLNMKSARAHCGMGMALTELGRLALAEVHFEKALECDSQSVVALSHLMGLATEESKILSLRTKLERFLEKNRKSSDIRYLHAVCEFKLGRYQACQREIETLLNEDAGHVAAGRLREELSKHLKNLGG